MRCALLVLLAAVTAAGEQLAAPPSARACRAPIGDLADPRSARPNFIRTACCEMRPLPSSDYDAAARIATDPESVRRSKDYAKPADLHRAFSWGGASLSHFRAHQSCWLGVYRDGTLIGVVNVWAGEVPRTPLPKAALEIVDKVAKPEETWLTMSYHLAPSVWGQGVGREVGAAIRKFAFESEMVDGIWGLVNVDNAPSVAVQRGMGSRPSGRFAYQDKTMEVFTLRRDSSGR